MAAEADRALHVPFHREPDRLRFHSPLRKRLRGQPHHDLGTAEERGGPARFEARVGKSRCDHPDVAVPVPARRIDRDLEPDVAAPPPGLDLVVVDEVLRGPRPEDDLESSVGVPVPQDLVDHRSQRREPETPRHDHDVAAAGRAERPPPAVRSPHADAVPRGEVGEGVGHFPGGTDRMDELALRVPAADPDGRLPDPVGIEHDELPGMAETDPPPRPRLEHQGGRVRGLGDRPPDTVRDRGERRGDGPRIEVRLSGHGDRATGSACSRGVRRARA